MKQRSARILVVDDEPDLRTLYELTLLRQGYLVECAATLEQARTLLAAQQFDVVISDMRLPDGQGLELLHSLQQDQRRERCIVITAYGSADNAVQALKAGAFDYLTKPVDPKQFRAAVADALQDHAADTQRQTTRTADHASEEAPPQFVDTPQAQALTPQGSLALWRIQGRCAAIEQLRQRIAKVARSMAPVLIQGESGTGKELAAQALHACSHRAAGPFVAVNCAAIPENLLEAEFFGARKGAYTGATQDRVGYFQAARGGSLFLDEVGDLPLAMQSKLLRAIQERSVRALGSAQEEVVDVRLISATHHDLTALVQQGRFRQDLFYRLNVIDLYMPPLRERRSDIPELCESLIGKLAQEHGLEDLPNLHEASLAALMQHPLPGNVRELENMLHRALALHEGGPLHLEQALARPGFAAQTAHTHEDASSQTEVPDDLQQWLDTQERAILLRALQGSAYNRTAAAQRLGISLRQIRYRIARLGIPIPEAANHDDPSASS